MLCCARRDNGQADAHQNTACDEELASTPFVNHAQSTYRRYHHNWRLQGIKQ